MAATSGFGKARVVPTAMLSALSSARSPVVPTSRSSSMSQPAE